MPNNHSRFGLNDLRRCVRLILLLDAAERAGLSPMPIRRLHMFGYLSNILAPVWSMPVLDGKILKRQAGPFSPSLQKDLDALVGVGIVRIRGVSHELDEDSKWRLQGSYDLNKLFADPILGKISDFQEEREFHAFIQELAFALSALEDREFDHAAWQEATYADPRVDFGNVVDFAEWQQRNFTANAANCFERLLPSGGRANPSEKIHLYVRHLHERMNREH